MLQPGYDPHKEPWVRVCVCVRACVCVCDVCVWSLVAARIRPTMSE